MPREIGLGGPQPLRAGGHHLPQSLQVTGKDRVGRPGLAGDQRVPHQQGAVGGKLVQVRLQEQRSRAIQGVQITIEEFPRELVVERAMRELLIGEKICGRARDIGFGPGHRQPGFRPGFAHAVGGKDQGQSGHNQRSGERIAAFHRISMPC